MGSEILRLAKKLKKKNSTENECGLRCEYEKEQTGWKNFKCIRAKLSTKDGEKLVLKEVDNKKKKRKGKDKSDHIITEKITMRKCEKRSIHPILPEDFVEAPCMMLGKKKVNFICTRCRLQSNSSMCEDIDEMNFHIMTTHKKYIAENSITIELPFQS